MLDEAYTTPFRVQAGRQRSVGVRDPQAQRPSEWVGGQATCGRGSEREGQRPCRESVHAGAGRGVGCAECAFGVERVAGQLHPGQGYEAADGPGSGSCGCGRLYRMSTQPSP